MHTVTPAQLIPGSLAFLCFMLAAPARAQTAAPTGADVEPAATSPAPPPSPVAEPPPADLPPPPPAKSSPPPPPAGRMVIAAPAVEPARARRGYHVHDGFYLRLAAGLGGASGQVTTNRGDAPNFDVGGAGLSVNVWVGGTPWPGVAIGGLFNVQGMSQDETEVDGRDLNEDMDAGLGMLGVFLDAFPDPRSGLHLGGALGLGFMNATASGDRLEDEYGVEDYRGGGFGASGWVGYMGFVGPEWSLGGMLQLNGVITGAKKDEGRDEDLERRGSAWGLNLSFTALYH